MVKIYTKQGDEGQTGLRFGERVPKNAARVEAYGAIDEANAAIGLAVARLDVMPATGNGPGGSGKLGAPRLHEMLLRVQNELFQLGAELSVPAAKPDAEAPRVTPAHTAAVERDIDALEAALTPLEKFILPGGGEAGAALHLARTVLRRAERRVVALAAVEPVAPEVLKYVNRLADFLFVAARAAAEIEGVPEAEVDLS